MVFRRFGVDLNGIYDGRFALNTVNWTHDEKLKLLNALNAHGPTRLDEIVDEIPGKTIRDVQVMLKRYERLANYYPDEKREDKHDKAPIDKWTQILRIHSDFNRLGPIPRALKYIALFESRTEMDINLTDIYNMLGDISQGIAPKKLDDVTMHYLYDVFQQLAEDVEKQNNCKEKEFLEKLGDSLNFERNYSKKNTKEDALINPVLVPKELYRRKAEQN